jgi:cyanophycinase
LIGSAVSLAFAARPARRPVRTDSRPALEVFSTPAAQPEPPGHPGFAAVLVGGGGDVDAAAQFLCAHAHGGDMVILRASGRDAYNAYFHELCPSNSVTTLLITSEAGASDPVAIERVRNANAIFIAGGDQSNYVKFWTGPLEGEINRAIRRGVPIGGTSAGLAVLGQFAFSAREDTITSPEALANPFDPKMTIERDFLDVPLLRGIITDSHFSRRERLGRTIAFLARIEHDGWAHPARGIGIDEATAVLVEANGNASVVGKGSAYFLELGHAPEQCATGKPLTVRDVAAYKVDAANGAAQSPFDLKSWSGRGGTAFTIDITDGKLSRSDQPRN